MEWKRVWVSDLGWAISGLILLFLTRLPQLVSPHFLLDGDEAIVGLMAKHLWEGTAVPGYFYGQQYGFALFEVAAGAAAYQVLGFSDVSLRLAMLVIFWFGWLGFFKSTSRLINRNTAVFLSLLLIVVPAWGIWSMKARGGYLTAFAAANWVLWALAKDKRKPLDWFLVGAGAALAYLAQVLWLIPLIPFVAYALFKDRKRGAPLWAAPAAVLVYFGLPFLTDPPGANFWRPRLWGWGALEELPQKALELRELGTMVWSGHYYLNQPASMNFVTSLNANIWLLLVLVLLAVYVVLLFKKKLHVLDYQVLVALLGGLALYGILWTSEVNPRYFLPFVAVVLVGIGSLVNRTEVTTSWRNWRQSLSSFFVLLNLLSLVSFYDYTFMQPRRKDTTVTERTELLQAIQWCRRLQVQGVFTTEPLGQWQFAFYSHERPVARWKALEDRIPAYGLKVTGAYNLNQSTAVLVEDPARWMLQGLPDGQIIRIGERYSLYYQPSREWLEAYGYEL